MRVPARVAAHPAHQRRTRRAGATGASGLLWWKRQARATADDGTGEDGGQGDEGEGAGRGAGHGAGGIVQKRARVKPRGQPVRRGPCPTHLTRDFPPRHRSPTMPLPHQERACPPRFAASWCLGSSHSPARRMHRPRSRNSPTVTPTSAPNTSARTTPSSSTASPCATARSSSRRLRAQRREPRQALPLPAHPHALHGRAVRAGPVRARSSGPPREYEKEGFIFVFQDVRGAHMSEGEFVNMRPHAHEEGRARGHRREHRHLRHHRRGCCSNVPDNNGRVGQWGISYPGFYTSAGAIDSHPALKAVSPQAPIADWFWDDMHRHGAFNLVLAFNFFSGFGRPRPAPTDQRGVEALRPRHAGRLPVLPRPGTADQRGHAPLQGRHRVLEGHRRAPQLRRLLAVAQPAAAPEEHQAPR